jgi:hypothetical protein
MRRRIVYEALSLELQLKVAAATIIAEGGGYNLHVMWVA